MSRCDLTENQATGSHAALGSNRNSKASIQYGGSARTGGTHLHYPHDSARNHIYTVILLLLTLTAVVSSRASEISEEPLSVFVSIPPQACFVERIGGEYVNVSILVQGNQDPHTFEMTPKRMIALSRAKIFFKVGLPFENRLVEKILETNAQLVVVNTAEGIKKRRLNAHRDDSQHKHEDAGTDPHVWLSPPLVKIQAKNIAEALQKIDSLHQDIYAENLDVFITEVEELDAKIRGILKPYAGRPFYVFHPSFGYFADAYGLKQEAVETEGKIPTPKQLQALIHKARSEGVKVIFVQPQFDKRAAETIAAGIGGEVIRIDPLAGDVLHNLEEIAVKIEQALKR